jgi:hypothetical protein
MANKHADYLNQDSERIDIFNKPEFRFDSKGRVVIPFPGKDSLTLAVTPGSKIISQGSSTYTNKPMTDPASLRTGSLYATTVIAVGKSIYLDALNSRITVGEDGDTQWIMDSEYLRGIDKDDTVFGFFLQDTKIKEGDFSRGDVLIGNYPSSYIRYDNSARRLLLVGDLAIAGDIVSVNFITLVSGYKLEYSTGLAEFSSVVIRGDSTIGGTLAISIGAVITNDQQVITDKFNTSTQEILKDFNFGSVNYAGAVKSGTITWNTSSGAITGGSGVALYRGGIAAANAGVSTFTLNAITGDAYFSGDIVGSTITGSTIQTKLSGNRIVMTLNDMYLYDASVGGFDPVYGDSASISFARTDEDYGTGAHIEKFVMRKRKSTWSNDGNVMEMYFDGVPAGAVRNYVFLGRIGHVPTTTDEYMTHVVSLTTKHLFQLTSSAVDEHHGVWAVQPGSEIQLEASGWASSFNAGGSRILLGAVDTTVPAVFNWSTGQGGAIVTLGIQRGTGFDPAILIDRNTTWICFPIVPATQNAYGFSPAPDITLGDSAHYFVEAWVTTVHSLTTYAETILPTGSAIGIGNITNRYANIWGTDIHATKFLTDTSGRVQLPVGTNLYT